MNFDTTKLMINFDWVIQSNLCMDRAIASNDGNNYNHCCPDLNDKYSQI